MVNGVGLSDVVILGVKRVYFTDTDELDELMVCSISEDPIGGTELGSSVIDDSGFIMIFKISIAML